MKTHVLTVSRTFPKTHKRAGEETDFVINLFHAINPVVYSDSVDKKIHTIRSNYPLWEKRIKEVQEGKAILSLRYWSGKPYHSKQVEFAQLDKDSGCGVQSIQMTPFGWVVNSSYSDPTSNELAKNDGLSLDDFYEWFRGKTTIDMEPMAIIHFTGFRY